MSHDCRMHRPLTVATFVRNFFFFVCAVAALAMVEPSRLSGAPAAAAAIPFPQATSDLKPDPAEHFGTLPNGFRYVIMHNREPKGRVSLRLLVLAGSFEETNAQQGLAHFLEHMAFNGSTHYPPGTLVELLQHMGMGFGADTNASTSFDHTLYQLELPDTKPETVAEGLRIFADDAGGLLLRPEMINKERGIILSEKRTRDSVGYRTFVAQFNFLLGGTLVPDRLPIGQTDVIEKAGQDRFAAFYNTWYQPNRMVAIVVGDIDPAGVESQVVAAFSGIQPRAPELPLVSLGTLPVFKGLRFGYHAEPEAPNTDVTIAAITPHTRVVRMAGRTLTLPDNAAHRIDKLKGSLAVAMLNRRLSILAKKENAPFSRASADIEEGFDFFREAAIEVTAKADQWQPALAVAEQELRRALDYGFSADELKQATAEFHNDLEQAARSAETRRSDEVAGEVAESLVDREVFTSPAQDLELYGPALSTITAANCTDAFRAAWTAPGRSVFVTGNAKISQNAEAAIGSAYAASQAVAVKRPAAESDAAWGYASFGAPGAVASRRHIEDLDLTEVTFANGVRLNLKKTDFEANTIHVGIRIGDGKLTEPPDEPGLAQFIDMTFSAGGLGKHSVDDLERILAGRTVEADFGVGGDALGLGGQTNREDLALELQLLTATLTDPGYRPESLRTARKRIDEMYLSFEHTTAGPLSLEVPRLLASGDPRFGLPSKTVMLSYTLEEERRWLAPQFARGALEVEVVGDLDPDVTIAAVAATLGTLPPREAKPAFDQLRHVVYPAHPFERDYPIDTKIPKGTVLFYWPTTDGLEIHRTRRLTLLAEILSDRLRVKVREQLGGTYSPSVHSQASEIYPGYGTITAGMIVDPAKTVAIAAAIQGVAADLSTSGVTADELDRAKNPILTSIRESERTNGYWLQVLQRAQEKPEVLDWARSRRTDFTAIDKADLDALAKQYLPPDRASRVIVHPKVVTPPRAP